MLASLVAALGSGVLPAVGTSRTDLIEIMKLSSAGFGGRPRRRHMRSALAVIQIALSLVLIVGAGLFLRSLWCLRSIEPSLSTDRVIAATLNLTLRGYDQPRGQQFYEALLARVVAEPGIEAATIASVLPVTAGGSRINVNARATDPPLDGPFGADMIAIGPGYFHTLGVPLVAGRDFAPADAAGGPRVTVVNETMKQRVWGQSDPVGRTLAFVSGETFIVVGVARDTRVPESARGTPEHDVSAADAVLFAGRQSRREDRATNDRDGARAPPPRGSRRCGDAALQRADHGRAPRAFAVSGRSTRPIDRIAGAPRGDAGGGGHLRPGLFFRRRPEARDWPPSGAWRVYG